jgi:hypothetical protein
MKFRLVIWAAVGALVVILWTLYISHSSLGPYGFTWTLVYLTCPISLARHHALSFYFVLLVNAATYALVGAAVEIIMRRYRRSAVAR